MDEHIWPFYFCFKDSFDSFLCLGTIASLGGDWEMDMNGNR